jgi:hypothetical protein
MLKSLPKDLDETYNRILQRIREEDHDYAVKALQCLAFSARPMTLEEVAEVIAFNVDTGQFDETLDDPRDILEICSCLITISSSAGDERKGRFRRPLRMKLSNIIKQNSSPYLI